MARWLLLLACIAAVAAEDASALLASARSDPGATLAVLTALSARLRAAPDDAGLADGLDPLCRRLFLEGWRVDGRAEAGLVDVRVAAGDTLGRIARARHVTVDLLLRLNPGVDPRRLAIGQHLTVLDAAAEPLRISVSRAARRLSLWRGPLLVMSCPVGIGAGGTPTPVGSTTIAQRVKDPEWRDPATGRVHPPHSPGNLLGSWWLGFAAGDDNRFRSIGCHGWTGDDPARWLGQEGSRGCIRMRQTDIADLAALVVPGVVVEVR